jgi:hypothetical protein
MSTLLVKPKSVQEYKFLNELLSKMKIDFEQVNNVLPDDYIKEKDDWNRFANKNFAKGYNEDEPDYENVVVKEINPNYNQNKQNK